jgi:CRP-like cAMP-binding protein
MKEQLATAIRKLVPCSEEQLAQFFLIAKPEVKHFKAKQFVLKEGEVCRHLNFVISGLMRYFYIVDGEEVTGQFFFENGWYADLGSFLSEQPSRQNIQTIENSVLVQISKANLYELYEKEPVFERFGRLLAEYSFLGIRGRYEKFSLLTPEEHYLRLITERPKVIERVPLKYIASFLGIKPESLSRIRKRLFDERKS